MKFDEINRTIFYNYFVFIILLHPLWICESNHFHNEFSSHLYLNLKFQYTQECEMNAFHARNKILGRFSVINFSKSAFCYEHLIIWYVLVTYVRYLTLLLNMNLINDLLLIKKDAVIMKCFTAYETYYVNKLHR